MSEVALAIPAEISTKHFYLSLDVKFTTNGSIDVVLELEGKSPKLYVIRYVCSAQMIISRGSEVFYGIGARRSWSRITRDILIDFQKGVALKSKKKMSSKIVPRRILRVEFHGSGFVDNVTLSSRDHLSQFYHSADWLVRNQDSHGGWPITVARKLADGQLKLAPGWYSAMAQGQAMSVLARAYTRTKQQLYLDTALRSTAIFRHSKLRRRSPSDVLRTLPLVRGVPHNSELLCTQWIYLLFNRSVRSYNRRTVNCLRRRSTTLQRRYDVAERHASTV